jgi:4-diphosphocytidyl-2-C-methyl-D-erythritol kinase
LAIVTGVTVRVPAKLNLQLAVGPPRADGYHHLVTVFHAVSLYDEVTVVPADRDGVAVTGEGADRVPADGDNLALRAVAALRAAGPAGVADPAGVHVTIAKRIPVAAGLAGGSADAAAALLACNELWACGLSQQQLAEIGAKVGSDVAFALLGGTAVGRGRGEQLTPALAPATQYHWVLAFADGQLSTPEVYATLDRLRAAQAGGAAKSPSPVRGGAAQSRAAQPGAAQPGAGQSGAAQPRAAQPGAAQPRPGQSRAGQSRAGQSRAAQSPPPGLDAALMSALRSGDAALVGRTLSNDLQPAAVALFPALRKTLAAGLELGALGALVAGSGPTCVFLASSADRALALAASLSGAGVCRSVARATGPVPGAAIVPSAK